MVTKASGSAWNTYPNLGYINVKDTPYGAQGNGTTDDTAAVTSALAVTGVPVFFPPGTYLLQTLAIPSGKIIFGCGPATILKLRNSTNAPLFTTYNNSEIVLRDFAVDGNKAGNTGSGIDGFHLSGGDHISLEKLFIYNTLGAGIRILGGLQYASILFPRITGNVGNGITIENASELDIQTPHIYTSDASAYPGDGIALAPAATTDSISQVRIAGGTITGCAGRGLAVVGNGSQNVLNVSAVGTHFSANISHGFHAVTASQLTLSACISKGNGGDGFRLEGNTTQSLIAGGIADTNTGYGMREVVSGSTPDYNGFIGCKAIANTASNVITKVGTHSTIVT